MIGKYWQKYQGKLLRGIGFFLLGGLLFAVFLTPLKRLVFDHGFWIETLQGHPEWSVPLFLGAYVLLTLLGIPGTILTVTGGVVFGVWWGTLWSVFGATLGAISAFLLARYLFRHWMKDKFAQHPFLRRCEAAVQKMPLNFILALRFTPISPFNVVNFLLGLTPISLSVYTLGTFFGIIPGTFVYTWLGASGKMALTQGEFVPFCLALGLLMVLSLLPWCAKTGQPSEN
ncbi:TVP38/TMEM64 family protein [Spirulina sp. CS-785/01]|uniref:TVP38/TMEM64 family protein n=1 Tax=Spirulina sp. CS-785/01 TaxID=3021716 RepID=UPI00232E7AA0|nr:TVP38/TMEM64 family protein [Spirulina sp. CS-785/01]MDB9315796.1 TVP38/TMEM64 family protein [Spirulina sp. CS-785/01]